MRMCYACEATANQNRIVLMRINCCSYLRAVAATGACNHGIDYGVANEPDERKD